MLGAQRRIETLARHVWIAPADAGDIDPAVAESSVSAEFSYGSLAGGPRQLVRCRVANGRRGCAHTLERDGFALRAIPLQRTGAADLYDIHQCSAALYPLGEAVLREAFPGCSKVLVFDHVIRNE